VHAKAFGTDSSRLRHQLLARLTATPDTVVAVVALAGDTPVSAARMELVPGTRFAGRGAAGPSRSGAAAASTGHWSRTAPAPPRPAATGTSRSTPSPRAAPSWNASASGR
jgi:hypothetical protein